jgi:lysophospholipase L1-like esterase
LLSKWLDFDYYVCGFSGSCRGQLELADFFAEFDDLGVFVMDYDHNARSAEHLAQTHEPFFRRLREHFPDLPVLMMTAPNYLHVREADERRAVVRKTYENALAAGDQNVYFVDGKDFFGDEDAYNCTVDTIHPNDLGFYRMAKCIYPVLKEIIEK